VAGKEKSQKTPSASSGFKKLRLAGLQELALARFLRVIHVLRTMREILPGKSVLSGAKGKVAEFLATLP
jgi:hypothetical protein